MQLRVQGFPQFHAKEEALLYIYLYICRERVLKRFPGPDYLRSEEGVVWLWHILVNLHINGSPFYLAAAQSQCFMVIWRDGGLRNLCHSCGFACQSVLKMFPGHENLRPEDRWGSLTMTLFGKFVHNWRPPSKKVFFSNNLQKCLTILAS